MAYNSPYYTIRRKILFDYLEDNKELPSRTIARMLVRDTPEIFPTINQTLSIIRMYRGIHGNGSRNKVKVTKFYKQ
jgi:hypothetical protein